MTDLNKGAYLLHISISRPTNNKIGALGNIKFEKATYIYVGSAMNNLKKRIDRHLSKEKREPSHVLHCDSF